MLKVYCLKNNLDGSFYTPFFKFEDPDDVARDVSRMIVSDPDKAKEQGLHIATLCYLGKFDQEKGILLAQDPDIVLDCSVPFNQIMKLRGEQDA